MIWVNFPLIAGLTIFLWIVAIITYVLSWKRKIFNLLGGIFTAIGILALMIFILALWINLERPPLRTLGETRLWYSFFLPLIGFITYLRWRYKWFLSYSLGMAILFLIINYYHPETYDKTLMPALQSPWFIPHVIVYIFSYALLAASSLVAIKGLHQVYSKKSGFDTLFLADNLVYIGFAFLTLGLLFGALWAKAAWGHYWTWDPKETWAFLTWLGYLIFIHLRYFHPKKIKFQLWVLALAFVILLICWFGINYLPSAQNSVHTYASVLLVTATLSTYPFYELEEAKELANCLRLKHKVVISEETDIPGFSDNPPDRCYYCKSELFSVIRLIADTEKYDVVFDGSNADDLNDYRPGRKAMKEKGIISPLSDAGFTKPEIRLLSKRYELPTADKPAYACLASRFPYGEKITKEKLDRVGRAEKEIR